MHFQTQKNYVQLRKSNVKALGAKEAKAYHKWKQVWIIQEKIEILLILKVLEKEYDRSKSKLPIFDSGSKFLSLNVRVCNVEIIIRSVVHNVVGADADRLPKYSTLVGMLG